MSDEKTITELKTKNDKNRNQNGEKKRADAENVDLYLGRFSAH